jgi:hypothetical protein
MVPDHIDDLPRNRQLMSGLIAICLRNAEAPAS